MVKYIVYCITVYILLVNIFVGCRKMFICIYVLGGGTLNYSSDPSKPCLFDNTYLNMKKTNK